MSQCIWYLFLHREHTLSASKATLCNQNQSRRKKSERPTSPVHNGGFLELMLAVSFLGMLREKIFTGCSTNKSFVTQPGVLYCLFRWNNFTFGEKKHSIVSLRLTRFFHSIFSIIFSTVVVFAAADHQFTEDD